ncbi:MAG: dihydrodipicolinate synthase family protein [Gemmatimonadota bacterium]|nr:dihydrodipicolinate synthase family protein [Gemmatimonadota bacterium]
MSRSLAGVFTPVVTTFGQKDGALSEGPFRANIQAHLEAGMRGVVVSGSTGEAALLDEGERRQLIEWARELVPADAWLIAGTGGESTRTTARRCAEAAERGADAVLVVAPHYYGEAVTPAGLASHYRRVADECLVPVILYNIPKYMHFALEPALVGELAAHGNIIGIKDSSGDVQLLADYLRSQSPSFTVLTGSGASLLSALELGARGGILAVADFAASLTLELWRAFDSGDLPRARRAQERLMPLARQIVGGMGVPGIKAAMDLVGLQGGEPRPPLLVVGPAERAQLRAALTAADLALVA